MFIMELSGLEIQLRSAYVFYKRRIWFSYYSQAVECRKLWLIAIDKNSLIKC